MCFDRLWSSSGPIFELVQVLFKIYIVRSGMPCVRVLVKVEYPGVEVRSSQWHTKVGFGVFKPPRNSEVLTKLHLIAN